jgi:putative flippase GtrA
MDSRRTLVASAAMNVPQLLRFLVVGVLNTGFSYGVYALGLYLGLRYELANLLSLVLGILFSFRTQKAWVFTGARSAHFGRFVLAWGVIYLFNIGLIRLGIGLGLDAYLAGAAALPFVVCASYLVQNHLVFRTKKP